MIHSFYILTIIKYIMLFVIKIYKFELTILINVVNVNYFLFYLKKKQLIDCTNNNIV